MRLLGKAALTLILLAATPATAQFAPRQPLPAKPPRAAVGDLVGSYEEGQSKVCAYQQGTTSEDEYRAITVGLFDACPPRLPFFDANSPAPSTARLTTWNVQAGRRYCTYVQGTGTWTIAISLASSCPLAAGMANNLAASEAATARSRADR